MVYALRLLWDTNSDFYGIRTPTFMPCEPLLLGMGVVFNILILGAQKRNRSVSAFSRLQRFGDDELAKIYEHQCTLQPDFFFLFTKFLSCN